MLIVFGETTPAQWTKLMLKSNVRHDNEWSLIAVFDLG
jgi:hypothetical protein